jgi:archaellin
MGKLYTTGLTSVILIVSLFLIGITVADIISGDPTGTVSDQQLDQMTEETIEELSSYLLIKDQIGKFNKLNDEIQIEKIALWITPLVTQLIDVSQLTIQINDGENVLFLKYNNNSIDLGENSLFENNIWNKLNGTNFGFISIIDMDNSLVDYHTLNDCSDNAYVVFRLPNSISFKKHDTLLVTLFPSTGITRTIELRAPLPINSVVTFD